MSGVAKTAADTTLTRGMSVAGTLLLVGIRLVDILVRLLLAPALKLVQQVVERETHRVRFFQKAIDQLGQVFLVFLVMIAVEMTGARLRAMRDGGELTIHPATYRLVYDLDE